MQWIILGCGLLMLFVLTRKTRKFPAPRSAMPAEGLARRAETVRQEGTRGHMRAPIPKGLLAQLDRSLRCLNRFSDDELLPAARRLCENGRFLQQEAEKVIQSRSVLPKLPRSLAHVPRVYLFVQEVVAHGGAPLTADSLTDALAVWQAQTPLTADELNALPALLRMTLMEDILDLAQRCEQDQRAQAAAGEAHLLQKHGKTRSAQKLVRQHAQEPAFWEGLLRMEEFSDWMGDEHPEWQDSPEDLVRREHDRQAEHSRLAANAILSLRAVSRMPWLRLLEDASVMHDVLMQDAVYREMDAESRGYYRSRAAGIARRCRRAERAVCSAAIALCRSASSKSIASHVGFYLLDEGCPALLAHLHAFTPALRLQFLIRRHARLLFRLGSWAAFVGLLAVGFFSGYAIALLVPFALVFLSAAQQCLLRAIRSRLKPGLLPRMELNRLPDGQQVLAVCPVVLRDAAHALSMVKRLSVMHEANPDPRLHFMLLGDFQDSLTATLGADAQIIASASAAIEALREDTGHSFFYLQRERSYSPGEKSYHSRERRHGALETLLCLIQGRSIQDSFAFASIDPAALRGRYRYVITLQSDTLLPPGSALRLAGAMMHPLQKRRMDNGRLRGVSIVYPRTEPAPHMMETPLSRLLDIPADSSFGGIGIIDPEPFLDAVQGNIPEGRILSPEPLEGMLAGCACSGDIVLYNGRAQTLKDYLAHLHRRTRGDCQLIPCLLPVIGYHCRKRLDSAARFRIWQNLLQSLLLPLRLIVMLYAAFTARGWLLAACILLPELARIPSFSADACRRFLARLAVLPCAACIQADAIGRTLYNLAVSPQHLLSSFDTAQRSSRNDQPPMLFFGISMTFAGLFAAFPLLLNGAWLGLLPALVWAAFSFLLPVLEQKESAIQRPTGYMREVLLRLAQQTLTFFETAITQSDHALPPDSVQIEPNKGISHRTSPTDIGLYLCSLIAAARMNLLQPDETAERMNETLHTLEALPKWRGLLYSRYDTQTLAPQSTGISSADCGNLAVCLLTCAQGMRALLPEMDSAYHDLPLRLDRLLSAMELDRLYDADAELFWNGIDSAKDAPSAAHCDLLAGDGLLLSFVSIMLHKVPLRHWQRLDRSCTPGGALLSRNGGMLAYMLPSLFHPLAPQTLLEHSCRQVLHLQRRHRLGGAFGVSECSCHAFDPSLNYQYSPFGLPQLALEADIQSNVLAPYASMLCLPLDLKASFQNLQRLQRLGLEGPLGLFEAADFSPARTDGKPMAVVRSHRAQHQGMVLCAVCNALCGGYIANLFSSLPRTQAFRLLLEEPKIRARSLIRHPFCRSLRESAGPAALFSREAAPLCFPVDAHLLCGGDTTLLVDAQGGGYLKHGDTMLTRFHESCHLPSGMRLYLRDSESGAYWTATDPYLARSVQFEGAQAVYRTERFGIQSELRIWIDPLDGSCIHCLTMENTQDTERMMEICSYLEPDLSRRPGDEMQPALPFHTERLSRHGAAAIRHEDVPEKPSRQLWHLLKTETPLSMFRIQTDRVSFLGRGRGFAAPRAMELPISAVPDSLGEIIDPCISLRGQFTLPARRPAVFCFVTRMPGEQENPASFCERYARTDDAVRTYDSARTRSMVTARYLRLTSGMQEAISRMLGALLYSGQPMPDVPSDTPVPARSLERFGLSSGIPMLLYTCCGSVNEPLLKLLLDAHAFYRINGFSIDLVILAEDGARRAEVIAEAQAAIDESHSRETLNQHGGVHLLSRLSAQDEQALQSTARLILTSGGGALEQQLMERHASVRARPLYLCRSAAQWKQQLPSVNEVLYGNGYGGFVPETGDYQITLVPGRMTPSPWCNPLYTPFFCTFAAESGLLFTLPGSMRSPLDGCFQDAVTPRGEENVFLRDAENRLIWSLTRLPLGHNTTVRVTHAPGETTYESSGYGIRTQMTCVTDAKKSAGLRIIHLQNDSQTDRTLTLFHTCRFTSADGRRIALECSGEDARCFLPHDDGWAGLCAIDPEEASVSAMPVGLFQGLWSHVPFALSAMEQLPQAGGDTAILSYQLQLKPGESRTLATALIFEPTKQEYLSAMAFLRSSGATERLRAVRRLWEERLGVLQFDLPDQALGFLLGRWLPCQAYAGFRPSENADPLQAQLALLMTHPDETRTQILQSARARQNQQGIFLPYATAAYIEATADESILTEEIQDSAESLLGCCLHILESISYGAHDLPLTDEGAESVWQGMLLCEAIRLFALHCGSDVQPKLHERRQALMHALERSAWDGGWYLSGWNRQGHKLGSAECDRNRLDLQTQCWAVLCGASRERCELAMENVWRFLYEKDAGLIRAAAEPGADERDVQHTLTACLAMAAYHQLGQDERAWELLGALMPAVHSATRQMAARYRAEPYAMASYVYANPAQRGRGGRTWESSAAGCFLTVVIQQLLGLRIRGKELRLRPVVPQSWDELRITCRRGSTTYHLHAQRSCIQPTADGEPLPDGILHLADDGRIHEAFFPLRS